MFLSSMRRACQKRRLSAPPLAHHSPRRMQAALTRTWRKTRDNRQKHTPADTTLAPSLALCSARSQHESQCVRFSFPPTSCHLFSVLWSTELPLAAGLPQGGKNCLLESLKKKKREKENEKLWRTESGCCLDSHLGPLSCLVTPVFILNSCVCVHPLRQKR